MKIGVPKEIKNQEHRVGLTPTSVKEYVAQGHNVLVEKNAGVGIGANDDSYIDAGAFIKNSASDIFAEAEMIVKVKEPQPSECKLLRQGQLLYTYLHLAPDPKQTKGLLASGCTAIAYETITDELGGLPLLAPMSEVAGRLSIQAAAHCLEKHNGGEGLLLGGVPGVSPARVVVIGGGVVGTNAAKIAVGIGAEVSILDRSLNRLRDLDNLFKGRIRTLYSTKDRLELEIKESDVVIGSVLIPGASAPKLVSHEMISTMKKGAVLIDVAIDQGGCFETSKATTHDNPTYIVHGVVHYCVTNMPSAVPKTSCHALNNATLRHGLALANHGLQALCDPHLRAGLNIYAGKITNEHVANSLGMEYHSPAKLLAS
jgi:alanine dehydrogenase